MPPSTSANSAPHRYSQDAACASRAKAWGSAIRPRLNVRSDGLPNSATPTRYPGGKDVVQCRSLGQTHRDHWIGGTVSNFPAMAHVAVTVTDLDRSTRWYSQLLGADPVLDEDEQSGGFHHTVYALEGGQLFGLHAHSQPASGDFDEHRTGLDHVAFGCRDRHEL